MVKSVLEQIYQTVSTLLQPLTPEETYKAIVQEAVALVDAQYGTLFLEQEKDLHLVYTTLPKDIKLTTNKDSFTRAAFGKHQAFVLHREDFSKIHPEFKKTKIQSNILIPLSFKNISIGVLMISSSKDESFTTEELNILKLFGGMASLKIRNMQLLDETQKALEIRDLFISMAAHELRTPLTTINGYVQLLQSRLGKTGSQESRWVEELSWETLRLTLLVNELLVVNRIKSGQLQFILKECSLREIINRAILDFQFNFPNHQINFADRLGSGRDMVIGDFDKLLQIMNNLLDNAGKFSPKGSKINVSLKLRSSYLILNIQDPGRGISKKDLPRVFESFYKGEGTSNEGMGLGLFLAKNIIKEHRGSIHMHSRINKGTLVEIQLPQAKT